MTFLTFKNGGFTIQPTIGILPVIQWDWQRLWSAGTQVWSISGQVQWVKDPVLPQLRCNCSYGPIPGLGTPYVTGQPKKKETKTKPYNFILKLLLHMVSNDPQKCFAFGKAGVHSPSYLMRTTEAAVSDQWFAQGCTWVIRMAWADMEVLSLLAFNSLSLVYRNHLFYEERIQVKTT